jgi:hypothetical protein
MALPPIQYFNREDFPEIEDKAWAQRLFTKLNSLARQTQYGMSNNISVAQNLAGFWWDGKVSADVVVAGIIYPFTAATIPAITNKTASAVKGFPFDVLNTILPKTIKGVFVAQAYDITDQSTTPLPATLGSVAWESLADRVRISGILGMVTGRVYQLRLLLLSE